MPIELNNVLIVVNLKKNHTDKILNSLKEELEKRGISSYRVYPSHYQLNNKEVITDFDDEFRYRQYDIIFAIGGDGTFLYTARTFSQFRIPIVGINGGRLGFLMEVMPDKIPEIIDGIINDTVKFRERIFLDIKVFRKKKEVGRFNSLNDVVVSKGALSRLVEMKVFVRDVKDPSESEEGHYLTGYRADGVIISTPVGSTAYNLSAGGPILMPNTDAFVITPISPHTLGVRPVVISSDRKLILKIMTDNKNTNLTIDGQENLSLQKNDIILIKRSNINVKMLYVGDENFFKTLRDKLGWHL